MHIRKFTAKTQAEALQRVKQEMGVEAIILQTKTVRPGGWLGFLRKEQIQVTAAIEPARRPKPAPSAPLNQGLLEETQESQNKKILPQNPASFAQTKTQAQVDAPQNLYTAKVSSVLPARSELQELKEVIKALHVKIDKNYLEEETPENLLLRQCRLQLLQKGLEEDLIYEVINRLRLQNLHPDPGAITAVLHQIFSSKEQSAAVFPSSKYQVFVGPTGVGKTTTLAKMASLQALGNDSKIGFLTLDTYRISAVDQLKTYAEILNCPIEVAYDQEDLEIAKQRLAHRDFIYVDTAGKNYRHKKNQQELLDLVEQTQSAAFYLVLSANYSLQDLYETLEQFSFLPSLRLIVTKVDETRRTGVLLNILHRFPYPIHSLTYGQNVPDDIETFDLKRFIDELMRDL